MAQIDIKNTTLRITDGRRASLSPASVPANSRLTFTDVDYHRGTRWQTIDPITVAIVVAGNSTPLSVTVTGKAITINLATDSGGAATSTANQVIAAYNLVSAATDLASIANFAGSTGLGIPDPVAATALANGPRVVTVKIGDGNLTWDEKQNRVYFKDRGILDAVRNGDQDPVDVKFDLAYEFLEAVSMSGTPTVEDVLEQRGEASAWVSTSPDTCEPYCVDLELEYDAPCTPVRKEFMVLPMFRYESLDHDPKNSTISITGKAHVTQAAVYEF